MSLTKITQLTEQDKHSICFFILERGDIGSWVGYEDCKEAIKTEFPVLIKALEA